MELRLVEIAQAIAPGAHAVLIVDQAAWHASPKLPVPSNIEPPRVPWRLQFLRGWSHDEEDLEPIFA